MITHPGIRVDKSGQWYFQDSLLINDDVIKYFRANLHKDAEGYYILNHFRELEEKAYLESVIGDVIHVVGIQKRTSDWIAILDSGEELSIKESHLRIVSDQAVYLDIVDRGIAARFSPLSMASLMDYITEDVDGTLKIHLA